MKILIFSQDWYPENSVPQRRWTWLTKILRESNHEVVVFAPQPRNSPRSDERQVGTVRRSNSDGFSRTEFGPSEEKIIRTSFTSTGTSISRRVFEQAVITVESIFTVYRYRADIKGVDLVIGTIPALPTALTAFVVGKIVRRPFVIDLRDNWPELIRQANRWNESIGKRTVWSRLFTGSPFVALGWMISKALNYILSQADGILVTSQDLEERLRAGQSKSARLTRQGTERIATIRNVFPVESELGVQAEAVVDRNCLRVLYAGTLGRAQNLRNAIDAAEILRQKGGNAILWFVGSGASMEGLESYAQDRQVEIIIDEKRAADDLGDLYGWADTALVHLTDWEPLECVVPSKTYELMDAGVHISGVVCGETARLITDLKAGHIVAPEAPRQLATLWQQLLEDRNRLAVPPQGRRWVGSEREQTVPRQVSSFIDSFEVKHEAN